MQHPSKPGFHFESWWILKDTIEEKIRSLWLDGYYSIFEKFERLRLGLERWVRVIRRRRMGCKKELTDRLENLLSQDVSDDVLVALIDTQVHLNIEIKKKNDIGNKKPELLVTR